MICHQQPSEPLNVRARIPLESLLWGIRGASKEVGSEPSRPQTSLTHAQLDQSENDGIVIDQG
jgi:hypothetical protein